MFHWGFLLQNKFCFTSEKSGLFLNQCDIAISEYSDIPLINECNI